MTANILWLCGIPITVELVNLVGSIGVMHALKVAHPHVHSDCLIWLP